MNSNNSSQHVVLTGGIGSGKSSVAAWLAQKGVSIFDADHEAHKILVTVEAVEKARELWGDACLIGHPSFTHNFGKNIELDLKVVAQIIFNDPKARRDWEGFIHPQIRLCLDHWLETFRSDSLEQEAHIPLVVYDIPLFYEISQGQGKTGWSQGLKIDEIWVVYAPHKMCVERLVGQRGMDIEDIHRRIAAQMSLEEKSVMADVVIDNSGAWVETVSQLEGLLTRLELCAKGCAEGEHV